MLLISIRPWAVVLLLDVFSRASEGDKFADEVLEAHNRYRATHASPPLTLDPKLNALSQEWAKHLTQLGRLEHRNNSGYGENLYYLSSPDPNHSVSGNNPVDLWYSEVKNYTYGTEGLEAGHFTQVVWKASLKLGVGIARGDGHVYVVCNYDPPGNVGGQYKENVLPPSEGSPHQ